MTYEANRAILQCEPNCLSCKRVMIPCEKFANGLTDGPTLCHACRERQIHEDHVLADVEAIGEMWL